MDDEFKIMGFRELEEFYKENGYYADQDPRNAINFFDTDTPERRMERINKELEERKVIDVKEDTGGLLDALPISKEEGMKRRKEIKDEDINKAIEKGTMARVAKGGSMSKQMELFDEGGLKDEGGTVDPVSGNEVPLGSTQEEVRDDIPAQLSEGEFVFPADVVRYLGLEFLMNLRQKAKAGLKRMEEMGQMGNSDEATLPDDIPFTIDDLEMAEGGVVEAQAGTYVAPSIPIFRQGTDQNMLQQNQMTQTNQMQQLKQGPGVRTVGMAQPFRATSEAYAPVSYQQFLGPSARGAPETETRVYEHPDGRIRNVLIVKATGLPVIPGAIEDATKDGFVFKPQPLKEEVKVQPIKQQTSKVEPVSGDDSQDQIDRERDEAMYGPGGGRISLGGDIDYAKTNRLGGPVRGSYLTKNATTFGIGYTLPGGAIPGTTAIQAINAGMGNVPEGGTGKFTLNGITITKSAEVTNAIIKNPRGPEARKLIEEHKELDKEVVDLLKSDKTLNRKEAGVIVSKLTDIEKSPTKAVDTGLPFGIGDGTETYTQDQFDKSYKSSTDYSSGDTGDSGFGKGQETDYGTTSGYTDTSTGLGVAAQGGLFTKSKMTKQKPKTKKMKRGGLASKK
jgi:hypothetical protein